MATAFKERLDNLEHKISQIARHPARYAKKCFIGFDGFTDEIISVVDQRTSPIEYKRMETIQQLGSRITAAAGKSTNIELVTLGKKLGGNAPILANALLEASEHNLTFAGAIGEPNTVEPLFSTMAEKCEHVISLCPSAHSDALEFSDGKLILGKHNTLREVNYPNLLRAIDRNKLVDLLNETELFASVNWTMLLSMNELWERLLHEILPYTTVTPEKKWMFVDLADPAKRLDEDIHTALELLKSFKQYFRVVLGLNEAEAIRIAKVCGINESHKEIDIRTLASFIHDKTQLNQIVIHATTAASAATSEGVFYTEGPYCTRPKLTTGAGDNFNAGYCNGLLYELSTENSLVLGVASSGFYVRNAKSATLSELVNFVHLWKNGQLDE
ncbi:MAG: hypothetical protein K0S74_970 [Chlamydiales bacterium]|jgi:hypothetical protein|nr:hypothetical protein [Chlamydiales bacterium]